MKKDDEFRQLVRDRLTMGQDMDLKASVDACIEMGKENRRLRGEIEELREQLETVRALMNETVAAFFDEGAEPVNVTPGSHARKTFRIIPNGSFLTIVRADEEAEENGGRWDNLVDGMRRRGKHPAVRIRQ